MTDLATRLSRDAWGLRSCHGPSTAGGIIQDAACYFAATFRTKPGARWWRRRNHWGDRPDECRTIFRITEDTA